MTWIKPRLRFVAGGVFYKLKEIAGFSLKGSIYRTLKVINDQLKRNNKATTVFHWVVWLENYPAELLTAHQDDIVAQHHYVAAFQNTVFQNDVPSNAAMHLV